MIHRREFLTFSGLGLAAGFAPRVALATQKPAPAEQARFVSACLISDGRQAAAIVNARGEIVSLVILPARGHGAAAGPGGKQVVVFARRPGTFALAFDAASGAVTHRIVNAPGRRFYGHGVFSTDGRYLYTTENDYEGGRGVVGVHDAAAGFARVAEFASGGIGPHELILLADGRHLAVANGGILTHPDRAREKLNLDTMRPSLAYIDRNSGQLVDKMELSQDLHRLSIRHICADPSGAVWFGCQYEGARTDMVPLVGRHRMGGAPELLEGPGDLFRHMHNYVGSVAVSRDGTRIATTSPRGGVVAIWDAGSGALIEMSRLEDATGAAGSGGAGFLLSSYLGELRGQGGAVRHPAIEAWDNHLFRLAD